MVIYLYVKTHNKTGLKYFGKTTKKNPNKYRGSGKYWLRHLKSHGNDVSTEIIGIFENEIICKQYALNFSKQNNIVLSDKWANLQEENGLDGATIGHKGHIFTVKQLEKISISSKKNWDNEEYKNKMKEIQKNAWTKERKLNHSLKLKGRKRPDQSERLKKDYRTKKRGKPIGNKNPRDNILKETMRQHMLGRKLSEETKRKISESKKNLSKESKEKLRIATLNHPKKTCIHCNKTLDIRNFGKYHGDKCKFNLHILTNTLYLLP